jgi:ubiquinone/menaquinone biosynthesis C-methylase UbiE
VSLPLYADPRLAGAYQRGNQMPAAALRAWTGLFGSALPGPGLVVAEVGAGTGMFSAAMARWLPVRAVLGIDPSGPMLAQARRFSAHPAVRYLAGAAEALPLRRGSAGLILLSRVLHHLPDRAACARELAAVLAPGGSLVIRTTFAGRLDAEVYRYWPRLREIDAGRFPGRDQVVADFAAAGLRVTRELSFAQPVTASLREYRDRMATAPQSKFSFLGPAEFAAGLDRLSAAARAEPPARPRPVAERYDVLILTAPRAAATQAD